MKKCASFLPLFVSLLFFFILVPQEQVFADCDRPNTTYGNVTLTASCSYAYTVDGVDNPQNSETGSTNAATITLGNFNLTLSSSQKIVAGQFIINGSGGIAIGSGQLLPGGGIWIYDQDADGWTNDWTDDVTYPRRSSTASGYRRMGLMQTTTADCDDGNGSLTNNCYSYSQSTYYSYSQGNYYSYSYGYGQANYYSYGQSSYSYGYGQSSYGSYGGCFLAGTKVLMADGSTKEIQDIHPGDSIFSYDIPTNKLVVNTVAAVLIHASPTEDPESQEAGYLVINDVLRVTKGHNLWVANKRAWLRADAIQVGDTLLDAHGQAVSVQTITAVNANPPVYNLSLPGVQHNYFADGVLVHNAWKN